MLVVTSRDKRAIYINYKVNYNNYNIYNSNIYIK